MVRVARETSWHPSITLTGMRMSSDVWVVFRVEKAIEISLVDAVREETFYLPDSAFSPTGGQQDKFFEQKRRQHHSVPYGRREQANHAFIPHALFAVLSDWLHM